MGNCAQATSSLPPAMPDVILQSSKALPAYHGESQLSVCRDAGMHAPADRHSLEAWICATGGYDTSEHSACSTRHGKTVPGETPSTRLLQLGQAEARR